MNIPEIDFVIPWVDGNAPVWRADKNRHWAMEKGENWADGNAEARFRDWDNLQYWFRGVEKFAPWVNHIYFVTYGHVPKWLNCSHPKLTVVRHEDYIPKEYLPVFSVNPIEINLHRIKGLSENFVYFNDDTFLTGNVTPEDFFVNGLPRKIAVLYSLTNTGCNVTFAHMLLTMAGIVNEFFNKKTCMKRDFSKWFNLKYGKLLLNNILLYRDQAVSGLLIPHMPTPMKKSTYEEVWSRNEELMWNVTSHKFRDPSDITQYIFQYWDIMSGKFEPTNVFKYCKEFFVHNENTSEAEKAIQSQKFKMVCVNDSVELKEFDKAKEQINRSLDCILPDKSSFEI